MGVGDDILLVVGYIVAWVPWIALFLCQWKRSLIPIKWFDDLLGDTHSTPGLRGKLKYLTIVGALSLWMNFVLWVSIIPPKILQWNTFPKFCVIPRTFKGLLHVHQFMWHHGDFLHYASNNFALWTLGPLVLGYNRRTFVSSIYFTGIVGGFLTWLFGPDNTCIVGFSGVIFGWFGVLLVGIFLECPPKWWRLLLLAIFSIVLGATFLEEVLGGDDQEGVSWHGHAMGFLSGVIYSVLRFRRGWFLCEGFEDKVRPLGAGGVQTTQGVCQAIARIVAELGSCMWAGAVDLVAAICCQPPQQPALALKECTGATPSSAGVGPAGTKDRDFRGFQEDPEPQVYGGGGGTDAFGGPSIPTYKPSDGATSDPRV